MAIRLRGGAKRIGMVNDLIYLCGKNLYGITVSVKLPGTAWNCLKLPGPTWDLPGPAWTCLELPGSA